MPLRRRVADATGGGGQAVVKRPERVTLRNATTSRFGAFYVKDCAAAIQLLQMADKLSQRIYNIGSETPMTYGEFVEVVKTAVPDAEISLQPGRNPRYRPNAYMDSDNLISIVY